MGPLIKITLFYLCFSNFRDSSSDIGAMINIYKSSCPGEFCKTVVLKNFAKFTRKHLCHYLFLIELLAEACYLIKKVNLGTSTFLWVSWNFKNIFYYIVHPRWLLKQIQLLQISQNFFTKKNCYIRNVNSYLP